MISLLIWCFLEFVFLFCNIIIIIKYIYYHTLTSKAIQRHCTVKHFCQKISLQYYRSWTASPSRTSCHTLFSFTQYLSELIKIMFTVGQSSWIYLDIICIDLCVNGIVLILTNKWNLKFCLWDSLSITRSVTV